jgi:hypothetical protein
MKEDADTSAQAGADKELSKWPPVTLTDVQLAAVKNAIADKLRDPKSARFKGIKATRNPFTDKDTGQAHANSEVCGWVNAKNGGRTPFYILMLDDEVIGDPVMPDDASGAGVVLKHCTKRGLDIAKD